MLLTMIILVFSEWKLKDMCYGPSIPNFEDHYIEQVICNFLHTIRIHTRETTTTTTSKWGEATSIGFSLMGPRRQETRDERRERGPTLMK